MEIGFIGLGHMGSPMAHNLLKAGFKLFVYDMNPAAAEPIVKAGATLCHSIIELSQKASIIITSVQTTEQVETICLSENGIFQHAARNTLYIDCSSIDISATKQLHHDAAQYGLGMLDAPVSGGVIAAQNATLTFMVGGTEIAFQQAQPILAKMGKKIIHAGGAGHGQAAKICNNLLLGISMIGVCEAFTLAKKLGLDQKKFFDISSNASGQCWSMTNYCPVPNIIPNTPANHKYQPGFAAAMMLKDLTLATNAAQSVNANLTLGTEARAMFAEFVDKGNGNKDFSGIIEMLK